MNTNQIIDDQNVVTAEMSNNDIEKQMNKIVTDMESGTINRITAIAKMKDLKTKVDNQIYTKENKQLFGEFGLPLIDPRDNM